MLEIKKTYIIVLLVVLSFINCTEPYKMENQVYEKALVVETTITNELKHQEVKLTRVTQLTDSTAIYEKDAQVKIVASDNNTYLFSEDDLQGTYVSNQPFKALPDISYKLFITTHDGKQFESREEYLPAETAIQNLYAQKHIVNGINGIQVFIDTENDVGDAAYFRYEYDETYKAIMPYDITNDIKLVNIDTSPSSFSYDVVVTPTEEEKKIGYVTDLSQTNILQASIINNEENNIKQFPIRFIDQDDYAISERYSIQVKQFVQTHDSYNFYKILKELGSYGSLLTENQPGFIRGNIYSITNEREKAVGFFDVSSVSKKRIYFNYYDFNLNKPPYPYFCKTDTLDYRDNTIADEDPNDRYVMYNSLEIQSPPWELLDIEYEEDFDDEGNPILVPIYILLTPECGNCNSYSTNIKPEFWED